LLTCAAEGKKRPACFGAKESEMVRMLFGLIAALLVVPAVAAPVAAATDAAAGDAPKVSESDADRGSGGFLSYNEPAAPARPSFGGLMVRLVVSMVVIVALIYGVLMLVKVLAR
jgi:hypothetical protein